jgi:hypothetical protein
MACLKPKIVFLANIKALFVFAARAIAFKGAFLC